MDTTQAARASIQKFGEMASKSGAEWVEWAHGHVGTAKQYIHDQVGARFGTQSVQATMNCIMPWVQGALLAMGPTLAADFMSDTVAQIFPAEKAGKRTWRSTVPHLIRVVSGLGVYAVLYSIIGVTAAPVAGVISMLTSIGLLVSFLAIEVVRFFKRDLRSTPTVLLDFFEGIHKGATKAGVKTLLDHNY